MYEFSFAFNASYHPSYGEEKKQLINALDDIHSFTNILTKTILVFYVLNDANREWKTCYDS